MTRSPTHPPTGRNRPRGFTIIELLVVIVIIAILVALITPAIVSTRRAAIEGQVASEIKQLESAIAAFRATYGVDPPSSITLFETGANWNALNRGKIRRIWPNFDFTIDRSLNPSVNNNTTETLTLSGAECLVFFLGGMLDATGRQPMGFSKNPANPFAAPGTGSREGPFFEFALSRLVDDDDGNGFPVYIDPIPGHTAPYAPYLYASSNDTRGYDANELRLGNTTPSGNTLTGGTMPITDLYRVGTGTNAAVINPKTCQIISPGYDHVFGAGGQFNQQANNSGLSNSDDYDNITNFNPGRLRP